MSGAAAALVMRVRIATALLCAGLAACGTRAPAAANADCTGLPALTGRVLDKAHLLTPPAEAKLGAELAALEARTKDQLLVVTVQSLDNRAIEDVGLRMGRCWGIGQKGIDNGVILLVAPREHKVRIEVGTGLEALLTNPRAQAIVDETLVPAFRAGRFETGIAAGVARIEGVLTSDTRRPQRLPPPART